MCTLKVNPTKHCRIIHISLYLLHTSIPRSCAFTSKKPGALNSSLNSSSSDASYKHFTSSLANMRLSTLLASAASLFCLATARITGFSAPSAITPGAPIAIRIRAENYIQPVQDIAIAFGISPSDEHHPRSLGTFMGEKALGPGK